MKNTDKGKSKKRLYGITIFLLCTIIVMKVLAQEQNRDEMKLAITGWQHLAFTYIIKETPKAELARSINKRVREGWEMATSSCYRLMSLSGYINNRCFTFRL
jgi:hypothetical protein